MMEPQKYVSVIFSQLIHQFLVIVDVSLIILISVIEQNHKVLQLMYN